MVFRFFIEGRVEGIGGGLVQIERATQHYSGADPGFQVRGGALKKIAPNGGRRENFWGMKIILCENNKIINDAKEVSENFNSFFSTVADKKFINDDNC
jgi:hypothetical protein